MTEPERSVEEALAEDAAQEAIQEIIHEIAGGDNGLLLRWVVVAEAINDDGERRIVVDYSEGLQDWEYRGLFAAGLRYEAWQEGEE